MDYNIDEAVQYHYGKFPPKELNYSAFYKELNRATEALSRFDQELKTMHNNEILLAPLRNQEAVLSSRIEGTISTMDEILQYEANESGKTETPYIKQDVIETILYQRALKNAQYALKEGYRLTEGFIRQMHQQLLSFGRGTEKTPGKFKTEQNYLADKDRRKIVFIPIRPEKLQEGLETMFDFINHNEELTLIKTALMHLEFEALHPFKDGNGRIGRMLIPLYLWKNEVISQPHFYISGYFEENKDEYIEMMRNVSRNEDWENWLRFFFTAVEKQAEKNLIIAEKIQNLYEEMKQEFTNALSSRYSINALDFLFTNPVYRNNRFTQKSDIPAPTAAKFTKKLLEAELIKVVEEAAGSRPAMYSFEPLMRLVRI